MSVSSEIGWRQVMDFDIRIVSAEIETIVTFKSEVPTQTPGEWLTTKHVLVEYTTHRYWVKVQPADLIDRRENMIATPVRFEQRALHDAAQLTEDNLELRKSYLNVSEFTILSQRLVTIDMDGGDYRRVKPLGMVIGLG